MSRTGLRLALDRFLGKRDLLDQAARFLENVAAGVRETPLPFLPRLVVAVDVAYGADLAAAAAVAWDLGTRSVAWSASRLARVPAPYTPGFFFLREAPLVVPLLEEAPFREWVALLHGHGRAHPLGAGLASVVGVALRRPAVGCAGSLLCGGGEPPGLARGCWSPVLLDGARVGAWVRTREATKPVVVSVGHAITLEEAVKLVVGVSVFRFPEPLRLADRLAREALRAHAGGGSP